MDIILLLEINTFKSSTRNENSDIKLTDIGIEIVIIYYRDYILLKGRTK